MYYKSGIVLDCRKETRIKHLIEVRKIQMGIRNLPAKPVSFMEKIKRIFSKEVKRGQTSS